MVDFDEIARRKKEDIERTERDRTETERQQIELSQRLSEYAAPLVNLFVAGAERFNEREMTSGNRIEIERIPHDALKLRRFQPPYGALDVQFIRNRTDATVKCTVGGHDNTGRAESQEFAYSIAIIGNGFVARDKRGRSVTPEEIVKSVADCFFYYLA